MDGLVREVDIQTGRMEVVSGVELPISDNTTLDAPTGRWFMAGADPLAAGRVTAWDADDGRVVWTSEEDSGTIASISPAGTALVLAHETGSVEHLDLVTGARRDVPFDPAVELVDLDWAPDGSSFAGATTEGTVTLWDAQTLEPRAVFRGHSGTVSQVVHSADGANLYASGFDGAVIAWDLTGTRGIVRGARSPTPVEPFRYPSGANGVLAANGSVAVSYRADGALALVDVPAAVTSVVPVEVSGAPAQLIIDPAGRYAALLTVRWPASPAGEIQVVDVASRRLLPNTIQVIADFTSPAAFAGDGRSIVTADEQTVLVWDARSGKPAAGSARYVAREYVVAVAPDATGRIVAVGVRGGGVEVGDTATGALLTALVPPGGENLAVTPLSFSPDGRWLAGGSESGRVVVWDTATWDVARTWVAVQGGRVDSLAFTPDSRSVVAGGAGTASVWSVDPRTPAGMTLPLSALPSQSDVAVSTLDEGQTVVTLTNDKGVQLWAFSPQALLDHACDLAGRNLTPDEWSTALPNLPYAQTCPAR
jgi:WD40 repeat protein